MIHVNVMFCDIWNTVQIHSVSGGGDLFLTLWRSCVVQCIAPCHAAYMTVINAIMKDIRHAKVLM